MSLDQSLGNDLAFQQGETSMNALLKISGAALLAAALAVPAAYAQSTVTAPGGNTSGTASINWLITSGGVTTAATMKAPTMT